MFFTFLTAPFEAQKFIIFIKYSFIFSFLFVVLYLRNCSLIHGHAGMSMFFSQGLYSFKTYIWKCDQLGVNFCIRYEVGSYSFFGRFLKVFFYYYYYFFKFYFIFKLYIIVLVLPNIKMNPPQVYMCSPS